MNGSASIMLRLLLLNTHKNILIYWSGSINNNYKDEDITYIYLFIYVAKQPSWALTFSSPSVLYHIQLDPQQLVGSLWTRDRQISASSTWLFMQMSRYTGPVFGLSQFVTGVRVSSSGCVILKNLLQLTHHCHRTKSFISWPYST